MKYNVSVSLDDRTMQVVSALMDQRHISRSQAINFLAWQGVLRLQEINAEGAQE